MANRSHSSLHRRDFVHLGVLVWILGTAGCNEEGAVQKVDTPPTPTGNRNHLSKLKEEAAKVVPAKKK